MSSLSSLQLCKVCGGETSDCNSHFCCSARILHIPQNIGPRLIFGPQFSISMTLALGCTGDAILAQVYGSPRRLAVPIFLSLFFTITPNLTTCYLPGVGTDVTLLNCILSTGSRCAGSVTGTVPDAVQQNWFCYVTAAPAPVYIYFIVFSGSCHSTAYTGLFSLGTITRGIL